MIKVYTNDVDKVREVLIENNFNINMLEINLIRQGNEEYVMISQIDEDHIIGVLNKPFNFVAEKV